MPQAEHNSTFPATRWTFIQIVQGQDRKQAALALEEICQRYWYPVYAFFRRSGQTAEDAEDLTQILFQKLVAGDVIQQMKPEDGRLRSYLIAMGRRLIGRKSRHDSAQKRGGGANVISLDAADERYTLEAADSLAPERLYDHAWALQLLETVRRKLRDTFVHRRRADIYEALEPYLGCDDAPAPYEELAARLNSNANTVRVLVHRLRKSFRELLENEIACTVVDPAEIAEELAWFREVLR